MDFCWNCRLPITVKVGDTIGALYLREGGVSQHVETHCDSPHAIVIRLVFGQRAKEVTLWRL